MLVGRTDSQVKVRGNRVEIAEVELALANLENVNEVAVVARIDPSGDHRLVAYVVPGTERPSIVGWRLALTEHLPHHMIPERFVILPRLPLTPSGKVDRRALPEPEIARRRRAAGRAS